MMINWDEINHIFFDMDGTLLDLHYDNHFWEHHLPKRYADLHNIPTQLAKQQIRSQILSQQGHLNWYCIDYWSDTLKIDIMALKHETADKIQWRPHAQALLAHLKSLNKPLYLVTNAHPKSIQIKNQYQPLFHHFQQIVSSHNLQAAKESPLFWQALRSELTYHPSKTVFFDDNIQVLNAAKHHGKLKHLYAIAKPDSQRPRLNDIPFPTIECFSKLLPQIR